jgi:fibronectin-binding autotransporter adhesin
MQKQLAAVVMAMVLGLATVQAADLTWDPGGGGSSDGAGTWLGTGAWWDGGANVDWTSGSGAIIGNGGAGGTITLGAVSASTVVVSNFTGTYQFSGGSLDQSGGITIDTSAGDFTFQSTPVLTGGGDIVLNGGGNVSMYTLNDNNAITGDTILNDGGRLLGDSSNDMGDGNFTINEGIYVGRYNGNLTRAIGTGAGEFQLGPGTNGFSANNKGFTLKFSNDASTVVKWGAPEFNPTVLVLQDYAWNATIRSSDLHFENTLDLNGADRTILQDKDEQNSAGNFVDGSAQMKNPIINSDGSNPAGLIKTGPGRLILSDANTFDGGLTVSNGAVQFDLAAAMPTNGNHAFQDGSALWVSLKGGDDFSADASGGGSLGGLLSGTGPGSSTVSYTGTVDLVLRPGGSPDYAGPLSMTNGTMGDLWIFDGSMTLSGTGTYAGSTTIGRRGGSPITVTLDSSTALSSGTPVQVDTSGASKLDLNGYDATIGLLTLGSNNGGARGQVSDTAGTGTLTLTNGVFCDDHNNGNGGIFAGFLDLNGTNQTFSVRDGSNDGDLLITSVVQNGGLIFDAVESGAGLELAGTNTYTGGTDVSGGKLILSGSLGDSSMTISGGTVEGPGALIFNVSGPTSDQIVMTGGTLDASALSVNVNSVGATKPEYVIVDATGGGTISGTFVDDLPNGWFIDYTATTVTLTAPPSGTSVIVR